jgi:hypothetical protein
VTSTSPRKSMTFYQFIFVPHGHSNTMRYPRSTDQGHFHLGIKDHVFNLILHTQRKSSNNTIALVRTLTHSITSFEPNVKGPIWVGFVLVTSPMHRVEWRGVEECGLCSLT